MYNTDHLLPQVIERLNDNNTQRIKFIQEEKWIPYPQAHGILRQMDLLLDHPKKSRMPSMLLVGNTNNGKTSLVKKFLTTHSPKQGDTWQETTEIPVICVQAPFTTNVSDLYSEILEQFAVPYKNTDKSAKKEQLIKYYCGLCKLKVLIIDEIHNILTGSISKQSMYMNALKNLSNSLQISIVLVGVKEALRATNTNEQINNRFKPVFLPKWEYSHDYLSMLVSLESTIPIQKASSLAQNKKIALKILDLSEGYIGEMVDLLNLAAIYAIETQSEKITLHELTQCGFVKPSLRKDFEGMLSL